MKNRALILAGGGSRGAYEVGVWQGLQELGITFNTVIGTSVGALNGAIIAQGNFDIAMLVWSKLETKMVFDVDVELTDLSIKSQFTAMGTFFKEFLKKGGASCSGLSEMLQEYINEDTIRNSPIEFGLVTLKLSNLTPIEVFVKDIAQGKLIDYMIASSSCFPAVKAHEIDGETFVDGGYIDNLPSQMAINKGITDLIVVDLECIGVVKKLPVTKDITVKTIKCKWDLGNFLLFEKDQIKRNIRLGYLDTMKAYNAYDGSYYTFIKPELTRITKNVNAHIDTISKEIGITILSKSHNMIDGAFKKSLVKFVTTHTNTPVSIKSIVLTCMECCGLVFDIPPTIIYSSNVYKENTSHNIHVFISEYTQMLKDNKIDEENLKITDLPAIFKLLNSKSITILLYRLIKKSAQSDSKSNFMAISSLFPKEFFAALYILFELDIENFQSDL